MELDLMLLLSSIFIAISFVIFTYKSKSVHTKNLPPGSFGWPIIGETLEFLFDNPENFVRKRMQKYSPHIFKTNILGEKTVVICGPNGHKFIFSNDQNIFTAFRPHAMQKIFRSYQPTPPSASASASATSRVQVTRDAEIKANLKTPGFLKPDSLSRFLGTMDSVARHHVLTWWGQRDATDDNVAAFALVKVFTLTLACRFFLGLHDGGSERMVTRLVAFFDDITSGMHSVALNLPGTRFYRANNAAVEIRKELRGIIEEKKRLVEEGMTRMEGILVHMMMAKGQDGKCMEEGEIADKMMGLLVAGYSTVATAITFFIKYVGERPDIYRQILREQREIAKSKKSGEALEWEDIQKMKYSWNVIYEVMRFTPPLQGTFREALTDFTYHGYTIPKGWKVYWTNSTTNKNPEHITDPKKFDPSRYEEGNNMSPFTFVPFGGGSRMCPGKEYARLAILSFVHNLVINFKWELLDPNEKIIGDMMPTPQNGLPIRLFPH